MPGAFQTEVYRAGGPCALVDEFQAPEPQDVQHRCLCLDYLNSSISVLLHLEKSRYITKQGKLQHQPKRISTLYL